MEIMFSHSSEIDLISQSCTFSSKKGLKCFAIPVYMSSYKMTTASTLNVGDTEESTQWGVSTSPS